MKALFKISALFYKLHLFFLKKASATQLRKLPISEINKRKWYEDNQEKTLRYVYSLDEKSVVMDVGGYEGDFAAEIFARYQSKIYVFEPVAYYIDYLNHRFMKNTSIKIMPYGLGAKNEEVKIYVMEEASSYARNKSIHKQGKEETGSIIDVEKFFNENSIDEVGLIKINIEGGEYDLLDKMIEKSYTKKCKNIQVQFHDFYPDFQRRYDFIKSELNKTHKLTYNYPFVWENWELK